MGERIERRVLDPTQRAVVAHHNGGYRVSAGLGFIVFDKAATDIENYDAAQTAKYTHNMRNGLEYNEDRRHNI
jgi:hypothetical protein